MFWIYFSISKGSFTLQLIFKTNELPKILNFLLEEKLFCISALSKNLILNFVQIQEDSIDAVFLVCSTTNWAFSSFCALFNKLKLNEKFSDTHDKLFNMLAWNLFKASEMELDYSHQKVDKGVNLRIGD